MQYTLIRHAKTDAATIRRTIEDKGGPPLNRIGEQQAESLAEKLKSLGINAEIEPVAVSELLRAKQTAELAGFRNIESTPLLNEINIDDPESTHLLISQAKIPTQAKVVAQKILRNPPRQRIWITHGMVIAALLTELGLVDPKHFIPDYCEVLQIEL